MSNAAQDDPEVLKQPVFVTGGSGLVGAHLINRLVAEGREVRALYRNRLPDLADKEKVTWLQGDILDVTFLDEAMQGVGQVYHCAAIVSFDRNKKAEMFAVNIEGTANVVNAALNAGIDKLCYVSSVSALGEIRKGQRIDENMDWSEETSDSNYGKSKYLAEMEVWRGVGEGLKTVIVNPVIILGAGDWNESSTKIFKTAYEEFPWYTEGINAFVDVNDVVDAMLQLMQSEVCSERFIVSAESKTFRELFTAIAVAFGKKPPHLNVNPLLAAVVWRYEGLKALFTKEEPLLTRETARSAQNTVYFDNSKLQKFLPSFTYTPFAETIERVCKELRQKNNL